MATVIFQDEFTETGTTTLASHTPTTAGTAWVGQETTDATLDAQADDECGPSGNVASGRTLYTTTPAPSDPDYDVQVTLNDVKAVGSDDPWGVIARHTGGADGDFYAAGGYPQAAAADTKIWKKTGGASAVRTELASTDVGVVAGDKFRFELRTDSQELFHDSGGGFSSVASASNDDSVDGLASAGLAGLAMGNFTPTATDDINGAWGFDDYIVTEQAAAATGRVMGSLAGPGGLAGSGGGLAK